MDPLLFYYKGIAYLWSIIHKKGVYIMTSMEFQQWKQNFIRDYLDETDDMEVLEKIKKYAKSISPRKRTLALVSITRRKR